jgi:hypothetical protein
MKKDDDLESALLAAKEPAPAPAKGYAYALTCALLASLTSIIYGYSKSRCYPPRTIATNARDLYRRALVFTRAARAWPWRAMKKRKRHACIIKPSSACI